jgi:hypothetical protein
LAAASAGLAVAASIQHLGEVKEIRYRLVEVMLTLRDQQDQA